MMRRMVLAALTASAVLLAGPAGVAAADVEGRFYLTTDKSQLMVLPGQPFTKVSITNPAVADVNVITPTQLLLNGKGVGITSLMVFYPDKVRAFDLVVNPAPVVPTQKPAPAVEPHAVLVQRAGKVSEQLFSRGADAAWVELGSVKLEPADAGKK